MRMIERRMGAHAHELSHPDLDTTIVGTKSVEHLNDNIAAALKGPLPDEVVAEAKKRLEAAGATVG